VRRADHTPRYQVVGFFALRGIYQTCDTKTTTEATVATRSLAYEKLPTVKDRPYTRRNSALPTDIRRL
jgi:hypothetical protein